jgi:tetratricopeptide (TPR) repeat protein
MIAPDPDGPPEATDQPPIGSTRPDESPAHGLIWLIAAATAVFTFIVFLPAVSGQFLNWDDLTNFVDITEYRGLRPENIAWMFTTSHAGHYQPLAWLTIGLDYTLWGLNPTGFHLTSNAIHAASAALFCLVCHRLFSIGAIGGAAGRAALAGLAALLFAVHPLRVESVAWLTERRDVVSMFFLLLTVLGYLRAAGARGGARGAWLAAACAAFMLAALTKVSVVMLPIGLLILDWYPLRRLGSASGCASTRCGWSGWFGRPVWHIWLEKAPFFAISLGFGLLSLSLQRGSRWFYALDLHPLPGRIAQSFYSLVFYPWKTVVPVNLCPLYELTMPLDPLAPRFVASAIIVIAAGAVLLACRRRGWAPPVLAVLGWYIVFIAPLVGMLQNGPQLVADRFSYLATMGLAPLGAAALHRLWVRLGRTAAATMMLIPAALGIVILLGALTWRQCGVWQTNATLWEHVVAVDPDSSMGRSSLGLTRFDAGAYDEAVMHLRRSVELEPRREAAHERLWAAMERSGASLDQLIDAYEASLRVNPRFVTAHVKLGEAMLSRQQAGDAMRHFEEALAIDPASAAAHLGVAMVQKQRGEVEAAMAAARRSLEADPLFLPAHCTVADLLHDRGRLDEAMAQVRQALEIDPAFEPARQRLDLWLVEQRRR